MNLTLGENIGGTSTPLSIDIGGGSTPVTMDVGGTGTPLATEMNVGGTGTPLTTDMNIGGGAKPLATDITLHTPDVMRTRSEVTTDSRMLVDLKPVVMDLKPVVMDMCTTLNFGRVPEVCVRQPYEHRFRVTLFGTEIMAFEFRGENRSYTENMPGRPAVVGATHGRDRRDERAGIGHEDDPEGGPGLVIPI
jgi:hypothetical protein